MRGRHAPQKRKCGEKVGTSDHTEIITLCLPAVLLSKIAVWSKVSNFSPHFRNEEGIRDFSIPEVCGKIPIVRPHRICPSALPAGLLSQNPGVLGRSKICRILPKTPLISMRQMRADYRWNATFPQIKPAKINLSLFWQVTLPRRACRIPGPGGPLFKFVASSARAGGHIMWPPCEPGL